MDATVREAKFVDLEAIRQHLRLDQTADKTLQEYRSRYFTESGGCRSVLTGYPDYVWVAEANGRVVGYIHVYVCITEEDEVVDVALVTDDSLPPADAAEIRARLRKTADERGL